MADTDLRDVLKECQKAAMIGYKIASTQEKTLSRVLKSAEERIKKAILEFNSSPCYAPETAELLESQLIEINNAFNQLSFAFKEDLNNLREGLSKFHITLYGRTMAGKSTLMEILTEGNGSSIGKGAQRTTLDVRTYEWNGLEIKDVPGIGAVEGENDEQVAFEAAKTADLILFLITDDAPQAVEAECFSKIVDLGKPIIGIMNVKKAIQEGKSLRFTTKQIKNQFDMERLNKIKNQFYQFSEQYGQTWTHIPFVYVHLQSAFMSQRANEEETIRAYHEISRIDFLKKRIVEQIKEKGEFYRIKTFIDIISNPVLESMENLLDQSQINSIQGRTILSKKRLLDEWKDSFQRDGKAQIQSLIVKIRSELNSEIAAFAEEHFDDKNADKAWEEIIRTRRIETRCQDLLEELETKSNDKLKEISREITSELKFATSFAGDKSLRMHKLINGKRLWDWTTVIAGGGLSIAWGIASLIGATAAGPLGLTALAVSGIGVLGSYIFKSIDKKEHEARLKLETNLRNNVTKTCNTLQVQMQRNLDSLVSIRIDGLLREIDKINTVIFSLADTQKELAWGLDTRLMELNKQLVTEAIRIVGAEGLEYHVQSVARIPGNTSLILLNNGTVFPKEQRDDLYKLMSERIGFIYDSNNKRVLISRVLGKEIDRNKISIEEKIGVAHVPLQDATPYIKSRVRLAQQFSRLLIMNQ